MAFDGIVTKSIVYELNTCLIGGKINKVFEPNTNELILGIYSNSKNYALEICIEASHCRMHLTTHSKPNPFNAPNFCMLLRKHLIGTKIKSIETTDLERVITIELEGYNELNDFITKKLIVELMGKHSNIILLNENNRIIDSLRHFDTSSKSIRNIMPAQEYVYPISEKSSIINLKNFEEFYSKIEKYISTEKIENILCQQFIGISKEWVYFLLKKHSFSNPLTKENVKTLYSDITNIICRICSNDVSCKLTTNEKNKSDFAIDLMKKESPLSINFFIDDFYHQKEIDETFMNYKNSLLRALLSNLNKYKKKLSTISSKIKECNKMDSYKLYGELITANLYKIKDNNQPYIELENYYDNNNKIKIPLDPSKTPSYNAKLYFKKYNKLKNTLVFIEEQKKETLEELNYIESIIYTLDNSKTIQDLDEIYSEIYETVLSKDRAYQAKQLHAKKKTSKKRVKDTTWVPIEYAIENFKIFVGKNNKQNDYLTCKMAKPNDIWFHTKDIHGSHVILKTENKEVPKQVLEKCASLAAYYSKARTSSNVPVDYTFIKNVKKPRNSKPGMVIYTNNKTLYVNPSI